MIVYKIREKKTGLYSTGGTQPKWNTNGKVFTTIGTVKSHISNWMRHVYRGNGYYPYHEAPKIPQEKFLAQYEIVPFELVEEPFLAISAARYQTFDKPRYFKIIGWYTREVIGWCFGRDIKNTLREEPKATFEEITPAQYERAVGKL